MLNESETGPFQSKLLGRQYGRRHGSESSGIKPRYKRVLLKLSGEALMGGQGFGVDPLMAARIAEEFEEIHAIGVEVAATVGGGNIVRGISVSAAGMDRVSGDYMGMLATVINALALQNALEKRGVHTRVQSAIEMKEVAEPFIRRRAIRHLEKGGSSSLPPVPAIPIFPPTRRRRFAQSRSARRPF